MNQRKAGAILSYLSLGINSIVGIIYIPMLLWFLTKEEFGLYQLVGAAVGYLSTMDFGLSNTTTRYYSRYLAQKDTAAQENLLATCAILYGGLAVLVFAVGAGLLFGFLPFYQNTLSAQEIVSAKYLFFILLFNLAISLPANIFTAIVNSHERFIFTKGLSLLNIILQPIVILLLLSRSPHVLMVALGHTACSILVICLTVWYSFAKLHVTFKLHTWSRAFVKELLTYSFFIFLVMVVEIIYLKTGQLILGAFIGTAAVAVYSVSVQILMMFRSFSGAIFYVFLPRLSAIAACTERMEEMNHIFIKISRLQFMLLSLVLIGFILYGKPFLTLWVGADFLPSYTYTIILMLGYLFVSSQNMAVLILQAKNKYAPYAYIYTITGVVSLALSVVLCKWWGGLGCALATAVCLGVGQLFATDIYYARQGISVRGYFRNIGSMLPMILVCLAVGLAAEYLCPPKTPVALVGHGGAFCLFFFVICWKFIFNTYEKNLILQPLQKIFQKGIAHVK